MYRTNDINLAATLVTLGYMVSGIEYADPAKPNRATFVFDKAYGGVGPEEVAPDFFNGNLEVSALWFARNLRELKTRIASKSHA